MLSKKHTNLVIVSSYKTEIAQVVKIFHHEKWDPFILHSQYYGCHELATQGYRASAATVVT